MRKPRPSAWLPVSDYTADDVYAMQALAKGEATPEQQTRAINWIINSVCATYEEPFRSEVDGGERETSFALGKAFVGRTLVKMINLSPRLAAQLRGNNG